MSNAVLTQPARPQLPALPAVKRVVIATLTVGFAAVAILGARGAFSAPAGEPPLPILLGFGLPLLAFFAALRFSPTFKQFVLEADLRFMTAVQAWRFAGLGFIALYVYNVLPGRFAWPAGLADIAIAAAAPWILLGLLRNPQFAGGKAFRVWNTLGISDLVLAVGNGALISAQATGAVGEINSGPMALLPLVFIPAFLVPIFLMMHVSALLQARRIRNH